LTTDGAWHARGWRREKGRLQLFLLLLFRLQESIMFARGKTTVRSGLPVQAGSSEMSPSPPTNGRAQDSPVVSKVRAYGMTYCTYLAFCFGFLKQQQTQTLTTHFT